MYKKLYPFSIPQYRIRYNLSTKDIRFKKKTIIKNGTRDVRLRRKMKHYIGFTYQSID
ncbi:hypothetical protein MoryE10_05260 [Methylogaea oryzae]|uniref:Uncharacterized protein n=1 Tax=Methylogaea oryzae TaxID=1295382 RepID=A0A8D4VLC9_9GAMM|nr:hypothetical protein MoryE10_05260 [Methylogaea oryzae]